MGFLNKTKEKAKNKAKKGIKKVIGKAVLIGIGFLAKFLPLIIILSVVSALFDFATQIFTSKNTPEVIYQNLEVENMADLIEIKGNEDDGYYLDFNEEADDKIDKAINNINKFATYHNVPPDVEFVKNLIKAEVITQFPDLGGKIPEDSEGFQGAIKIRRVSPNKGIGELKNTGRGKTTNIEQETIYDTIDTGNDYSGEVGSWQEGKELVIKSEAVIFEQQKSEITPDKETGFWVEKYIEGTLKKLTFKEGTEVTYTGNYRSSTNDITKTTIIYVEVKSKDMTGYVKSGTLKEKEEVVEEKEQKTSKSINVTSRDKKTNAKNKIGKEGQEYTVAIAAGHNNTDDTGARNGDLKEEELSIKVAERVEELLKDYSNIKVVQTGSTSSNPGGISVRQRVGLARDANPDLCIQIHFNAGGGTGVEAIYKDGDGISQELAEILSDTMATAMGLPNRQAGPDVEKCAIKSLGIIENAATSGFPSVVTEGGFLDGSPDADVIRNGGTDKYAEGIVKGIDKYFKSDHAGYSSNIKNNETVTESIESVVRNMKYVTQDKMKELVEAGNEQALKVFTLDDEWKLITTTWSKKTDGSVEFKENSPVNFKTSLSKFVVPYEYLLYFYIDSNYRDFSEKLAKKIFETEIVIAVQDNVTTTQQIDTTQNKKDTSIKGYGYKWEDIGSNTVLTETCSTKIEPTYVDTWCVKAYKENSYSTKTLGLEDGEDEKIINIKGTVSESNLSNLSETIKIDSGTEVSNEKDQDGNPLTYTYEIYQRIKTDIHTISNKYESGDSKTEGQENKFVDLYKECKMIEKIRPSYLFKIIENNEKTVNLLNLTKYLIYKATGDSYGIIEFDFSEYEISDFSTISASGGGISLTTSIFTKEVFIQAMEAYGAKSGNQNFIKNFMPYAGEIYDVSVASGVNPELVVVTAKTEQNFKSGGGANNYWGIGVYNGSNSGGSYASLADGIRAYATVIASYGPNGQYAAKITEIYEQRKASGCDPLGYGLPGTLSGMQSIYSFLGKHEYGSAGAGGYYYMDPARAGVTKIYSSHEEFLSKCYNAGGEHASGTVATPWEQGQYTAWQLEGKIDAWNEIFGDFGSLSSGGDFLNKAKDVWMQVCTSGKYTRYGGSSIPCQGPTIDCSSFVSWVLYEYGYTEFAGWQTTTVGFMHTNWNQRYGWEEIPVGSGENPADKLQPGDIFVREGGGTHHATLVVEVKDGRLYSYDCGSTKAKWNGTDGSPFDQTYFLTASGAGKIIRVTPPK